MGASLDRLRAILRRVEGPPPAELGRSVAAVLIRGKRAHLSAGRDAQGRPFDPLDRDTLDGRRASSVPLVGRGGPSSRLLTRYEVRAIPRPGGLDVTAGWPSLDYVRFLRTGTRRMAKRDPGGFRPEDLAEVRRLYREYLSRG